MPGAAYWRGAGGYDCSGEISEDGRIGVSNRVWSEYSTVLASASGALICRRPLEMEVR